MSYAVTIAGLRWKNPVTIGAGFFVPWVPGQTERDLPLDALGAITVKSVSIEPWAGNPKPWLHRTPHWTLNSIGIQNPGVDALIRDHLPGLRRYGAPVVASLAAYTVEDFAELARRLEGSGLVDALELNMSCPNTAREQAAFGQSPQAAGALVGAVRAASGLPLFAKLTPDCADVPAVARACEQAGADALVLVNALRSMSLDPASGAPRTGTLTAGLSGPALKPLALRLVWETYEAVSVPIIGIGGIGSAEDAMEYLLAGAGAVSVGTATIGNPEVLREIVTGLERLVEEKGGSTAAVVGLAHRAGAGRTT